MYQVKIYKADLWGNMKDGFDNNQNCYYGSEETTHITPERMKRIARDFFEGVYIARTENYCSPMARRKITVEWESDYAGDDKQPIYGVFYNGTYIGELRVIRRVL